MSASSTCSVPLHAACFNHDALAVDHLLGGSLSCLSPALKSAHFTVSNGLGDKMPDVVKALINIASGCTRLRGLSLDDQNVHMPRAVPPGALGLPTFENILSLDWTVGIGMNVFNMRLFMDLLPLLPCLTHLSISPNLRDLFTLQRATTFSAVTFPRPRKSYPFSLTSLTCNFLLNEGTALLLVKSSVSTLAHLTLMMNTFELSFFVRDLPELPALKTLVLLPANRLVRISDTQTLLRRCPRLERIQLRAEYDEMHEVETIALAGSRCLRAVKLSSLHDFTSKERAQWMLRRLCGALPCLRRLEVAAGHFEPVVLALLKVEWARRRIVFKYVRLDVEDELLYL